MIDLETAVVIDRSPDHPFGILSDFEECLGRSAKGPISPRRISGHGGTGTHYELTAQAGPFKFRIGGPLDRFCRQLVAIHGCPQSRARLGA